MCCRQCAHCGYRLGCRQPPPCPQSASTRRLPPAALHASLSRTWRWVHIAVALRAACMHLGSSWTALRLPQQLAWRFHCQRRIPAATRLCRLSPVPAGGPPACHCGPHSLRGAVQGARRQWQQQQQHRGQGGGPAAARQLRALRLHLQPGEGLWVWEGVGMGGDCRGGDPGNMLRPLCHTVVPQGHGAAS